MPGYSPSVLGAATKVRIGEPDNGISTYSVVMIILVGGKSGEEAQASQALRTGDTRLIQIAFGEAGE